MPRAIYSEEGGIQPDTAREDPNSRCRLKLLAVAKITEKNVVLNKI
jgi:hypothetical protein